MRPKAPATPRPLARVAHLAGIAKRLEAASGEVMKAERTVVRMEFGSPVYGTSTPESDRDYKSVFVPSARDILLQRATRVSRTRSTGDDASRNTATDVDVQEFSLQGYLALLCEGQTVAVDMLFVPARHVLESSETWRRIVASRRQLLSRSIAPFVRYCRSQADKYGIKGSRMAAAKAAADLLAGFAAKSPNARLGDFSAELRALLDSHREHASIENRTHPHSGAVEPHLSVCGKLSPFTLRVDDAAEIYRRLWETYGERSRAAMRNEGIDWKALMHARRICDQALELLETGLVTFPRPNAEELLAIRRGERPYADVARELEQGMARLEPAMERCTLLPAEPDRDLAQSIVLDAYREQVTSP